MASSKRYIGLGGLLVCLVVLKVFATDPVKPGTEVTQLKKEELDKVSEAFGHMIGRNLSAPGIEFDTEKVIAGIRAATEGKPSPLSDKDYEDFMSLIQQRAFRKIAEENLSQAEAVLEQNRQDKEIVELETGKLQYKVLHAGEGAEVTRSCIPVVNYKGFYADGTVFASSEDSGGPISIPLEQTIPGFAEGIVGMREGEKRQITIHPDLGYGTSGHLPPNSLLVFEVELVKADTSALAAPMATPASTADTTACADCAEADTPQTATAEAQEVAKEAQPTTMTEETVGTEQGSAKASAEQTNKQDTLAEQACESCETDSLEMAEGPETVSEENTAPSLDRTSLAQTDAGGSSLSERVTAPSEEVVADLAEEQMESDHTAEPAQEAEEQAAPLPACA